jgi:hypothetical protein
MSVAAHTRGNHQRTDSSGEHTAHGGLITGLVGANPATKSPANRAIWRSAGLLVSVEAGFSDPAALLGGYVDVGRR